MLLHFQISQPAVTVPLLRPGQVRVDTVAVQLPLIRAAERFSLTAAFPEALTYSSCWIHLAWLREIMSPDRYKGYTVSSNLDIIRRISAAAIRQKIERQ